MGVKKVGLVQIGDSFGGQYYFPYSVGLLVAYAKKRLGENSGVEFSTILYKREPVDDMVKMLLAADVVFYSVYLWNYRVSLEIARRVKLANPKIINVFGGPQIPEKPGRMESFLRNASHVDVASYGEGELPFLRMAEKLGDGNWDGVPSVGYLGKDGAFVYSEPSETVPDVNDIPSPYLSGVFDGIMAQNPGEKWQGMLETNRGCPYTCAFCYWGKKTERKVKTFELSRVYDEIDWFSKNKVEFIFCCDANFGMMARDFEIVRKVAENKKGNGCPNAFSVQNTKNSKKKIFELHKILNESGLQKGVNLALQSTNEKTLRYIERSNIDNKTYGELQKMFTESNITTFTDIILGLPGETYDTFVNGISEVILNGQHNRIQFANLEILENTEMAEESYRLRYGLKTVEARFESHHTTLRGEDGPPETHNLVVATASMPPEDWVRAKVFAWMASLTHFGKLLQAPFVLIHALGGSSYRELIEAFTVKDSSRPVLTKIISVFEQKARDIQAGGGEFSASKEWLDITWHSDELAFINVCVDGLLGEFYAEAEGLLKQFSVGMEAKYPGIVSQAVLLSRSLLKQPFFSQDVEVRTDYNVWEIYNACLKGGEFAVRKGDFKVVVDRSSQRWESWREWAQKVVWYGYKKGDYIYSARGK
ncbi:MAG: radical SAM protein [Nitrospinae bacterium]|nr:radical SAM protein [Nitrospinota bacterium]